MRESPTRALLSRRSSPPLAHRHSARRSRLASPTIQAWSWAGALHSRACRRGVCWVAKAQARGVDRPVRGGSRMARESDCSALSPPPPPPPANAPAPRGPPPGSGWGPARLEEGWWLARREGGGALEGKKRAASVSTSLLSPGEKRGGSPAPPSGEAGDAPPLVPGTRRTQARAHASKGDAGARAFPTTTAGRAVLEQLRLFFCSSRAPFRGMRFPAPSPAGAFCPSCPHPPWG